MSSKNDVLFSPLVKLATRLISLLDWVNAQVYYCGTLEDCLSLKKGQELDVNFRITYGSIPCGPHPCRS